MPGGWGPAGSPGAFWDGLEALAGEREELWRCLEVPVGGCGADVAEDRGQQRQAGVDVRALAVPLDQLAHREAVAQVVDPGPAALPAGLQAGAAGQLGKRSVHRALAQPGAADGDQQGRRGGVREVLVAELAVALQGRDGRLV